MIIKAKSLLLLFLGLLIAFVLTGCKSTYEDLKHIYHPDIFDIEDDEYYVYVYRPQCEICSSLEETVVKYAKKAKRSSELPNLYVLNKGDGVYNHGIYCSAEEYVDFVGATTSNEVRTSSSPFLFKVKNGKVVLTIDDGNVMREELTL